MTSGVAGAHSTVGMIGFGSGTTQIAPIDPIIIAAPILTQFAFSVPSDGTITAFSAYFSLSLAAALGINDIITAQLYSSPTPNDSFMPIPGTTNVLGQVNGGAALGTLLSNTLTGLSIPITAGTRLLLVFYNTTIQGVTSSLSGFMSGGVKIE